MARISSSLTGAEVCGVAAGVGRGVDTGVGRGVDTATGAEAVDLGGDAGRGVAEAVEGEVARLDCDAADAVEGRGVLAGKLRAGLEVAGAGGGGATTGTAEEPTGRLLLGATVSVLPVLAVVWGTGRRLLKLWRAVRAFAEMELHVNGP